MNTRALIIGSAADVAISVINHDITITTIMINAHPAYSLFLSIV